MKQHKIELRYDEESACWIATSSTLPGLVTGGPTIADALRKAGLVAEVMTQSDGTKKRPHYTLEELLAQCDPDAPMPEAEMNG